ncbi:MAG: tripartite tricarboxylate transporter substrate binding protein [Betaproteobacteria bacterium]|nr:tripartite tricarboxylate transporter substrate binding protein [Betaproteobacteria bacterium]
MTKMIRNVPLLLGMGALLCLAPGNGALAQSYPAKPIRIVVAFAPGGPSDFAARVISQRLPKLLGQQVVVDNRAGAGGLVGAEHVAKSQPDGYTLLIANVGMLSVARYLYSKLPYDPARDFAPITNLIGGPSWLIVHPSVPVHSAKELIALAKARPGQLTYGSAGVGQVSHLNGELFKIRAGVDIGHVPYKGTGQITPDLIGGQISMSFSTDIQSLLLGKAGKLRMLAVTSLKRSPAAPEVPTVDESGLKGFEVLNWNGIVAPAGTPREIIARLNRDFVTVIQLPEVKQLVGAQGNIVIGDTSEEFGAYIRAESDKWSKVIKQLGIKLD